jgi:hypothetical protein
MVGHEFQSATTTNLTAFHLKVKQNVLALRWTHCVVKTATYLIIWFEIRIIKWNESPGSEVGYLILHTFLRSLAVACALVWTNPLTPVFRLLSWEELVDE